MDLQTKKNIESSLLISSGVKKEILNNWDSLNEDQKNGILEVFGYAEKMQNVLIEEASKNNPMIAGNLMNIVKIEDAITSNNKLLEDFEDI